MITLKTNNFNIRIKEYEKNIKNINLFNIKCSCGKCNLVKYGYYTRYIKYNDKKEKITILRVKCKSCCKTHAILPSFIVPYIQTPILEVLEILQTDDISSIDKEAYIIKRKYFNIWERKITSLFLDVTDDLTVLIEKCSNTFKQCFMQIHKGIYIVNS